MSRSSRRGNSRSVRIVHEVPGPKGGDEEPKPLPSLIRSDVEFGDGADAKSADGKGVITDMDAFPDEAVEEQDPGGVTDFDFDNFGIEDSPNDANEQVTAIFDNFDTKFDVGPDLTVPEPPTNLVPFEIPSKPTKIISPDIEPHTKEDAHPPAEDELEQTLERIFEDQDHSKVKHELISYISNMNKKLSFYQSENQQLHKVLQSNVSTNPFESSASNIPISAPFDANSNPNQMVNNEENIVSTLSKDELITKYNENNQELFLTRIQLHESKFLHESSKNNLDKQ